MSPRDALASARTLLLATASGDAVPVALVDDLVGAVLAHPLVAMALKAREEGPQRLMHALQLAAAVCEASRVAPVVAEGATGAESGR